MLDLDSMVSAAAKNHPNEDEVRCILIDAGVPQLLANLREIAKHAQAALGIGPFAEED